MATTDHECRDCGQVWLNNTYREPCPKCGSSNVVSICDEDPRMMGPDPEEWEEADDE